MNVDRLITQVSHWQPPRWAAGGRGDLVHGLVQQLADLAAEAEGEPRRPVPRLHDMTLPDQLRVVADDLLNAEAPPELMARAAQAVDEVRPKL